MDQYPALFLRWSVQGFLALGALTFLIQWLLPRWRKFFSHRQKTRESDTAPVRADNLTDEKKSQVRHRLQKEHEEKASSYMKRILMPREDAKRKQKEKKFDQFSGPAWKGEGNPLGGIEPENVEMDDDVPVSQQAARCRRLQISESNKETKKRPEEIKKKKVIQLPEEPHRDEKNCVNIKLRTPVGTICQRRFLHTHTVQVLMEYMTTLGFQQSFYTISTSYPRLNLSEHLNKTLWEMGFQGQVTLNVEEKDEDH